MNLHALYGNGRTYERTCRCCTEGVNIDYHRDMIWIVWLDPWRCWVLLTTSLRCTYLNCTYLNCTALHCTACAVLFWTALLWTALYFIELYCTALHCTALCWTVLYWTVLYWTALHCTALYWTLLHCIPHSCAETFRLAMPCHALICRTVCCFLRCTKLSVRDVIWCDVPCCVA